MKTFVLTAVALTVLLLVGLIVWRSAGMMSASNPSAEMQQVRVIIEDSVIAEGDPYAIIDPVWWSADIYGSLDQYEDSLRGFTDGQRLVHALLWYVGEVNNGGHAQFYFNSTGMVWPDAVAAFVAMGIGEGAEILRASAERLGGAPERERSEREAQLEQFEPDFEDLDNRFYELQERVNLDAEVMKYIRERPADFYFEGVVEKPSE